MAVAACGQVLLLCIITGRAPVAQLDRAIASGAIGQGFESLRARQFIGRRFPRLSVRSQSALHPALIALLGLLIGCGSGSSSPVNTPPSSPPALTLTSVATGFSSPLDLQQPNDGSGRFFVVEQAGTIRILQGGTALATPFLDIREKVNFGGEKGLLGLAFHPGFPQNHRFFIHYDRLNGTQVQSVIAEYQTSVANPNQGDRASERILLIVDQPFDNHKGGQLAFGPDGFLYIGLGDGGSGGDPFGNGQNLQMLLGKMLRIDVNSATGSRAYGIPPDNPFAAGGGLPEIWAYGLRNPWRFSFDRAGGALFCGDVGESSFEEIDLITRGGNFGWNIMEGTHCFNPPSGCNTSGLVLPITDYGRSEGSTVIGGYVYRGTAIPALAGTYLMGDFGNGNIWSLRLTPNGWVRTLEIASGRHISSFGQDVAGEVYVVDYAGVILRVDAR